MENKEPFELRFSASLLVALQIMLLFGSQQPAANSLQPTADSQQPKADSQQLKSISITTKPKQQNIKWKIKNHSNCAFRLAD